MANSNTSVLREFLVALGFRVDPAGFKKFNAAVESSTKTALGISAAVSGASLAIEKYVSNVAFQLEKLYYVSQRTGSTVGNLQALRFGAEQIGLTAEGVTGALEGMARQLRLNPGLYGLLNSLGVKVTGRDKADVLTDLVTQLRKLPFYQGAAVGNLFGIDSDTLLMLEKGLEKMQQAQAQQKQLLGEAGLTGKDAEDAKDFANSIRLLTSEVGILGQQLEKDLLPAARELISLLQVGTRWLIQADVATGGWSNRVGALFAALTTVVGLKTALGFLPRLLGAGAGAGVGTTVAGATLGGAAGAAAAVVAPGVAIGAAVYGLLRSIAARQQAEADYRMQVEGYLNDLQIKKNRPGGTGSAGSDEPIGVRQNNPGNLRSWAGKISKGGFAVFDSALEGLSAMAQNLVTYARQGYLTLNAIITKWAPPSENNTDAYIADIAKQLGVRGTDRLNLSDPGTLRSLMSAMIHHEQGYDPYSATLISQAANYRLGMDGGAGGGRGAQLQQQTHITVNGAGDPDGTAKAVAGEQSRVNGDLVRNLGGTVR